MINKRISLFDNSVEEIFNNLVIFDGDVVILKPSVDPFFINNIKK
jgi:hypothetical protein